MNIVFLLFPNVTQLDFTGPAQFLSRLPGASVHVAATSMEPVITDCGFAILPTCDFATAPQADFLCIPGGHGVRETIGDTATVDFVRTQAAGAQWVTSVCTGAFLLGAAGLLQGKRATCHWAYTHHLSQYGATHDAARVVRDGNLITAGGVTSGIDFALECIAAISGDDVAKSVQLALEYDPAPPFASGHPSVAPDHILSALRERVYDAAAKAMGDAIRGE